MEIKLLLTGLCFCSLSYLSYGQNQTQPSKEPTPVVVSSHPDLNAQRAKLDSKQAEIDQATTISRAQLNQLQDEFRVLKEQYVQVLSTALEKTAEASLRVQLQEEITRYTAVANTPTR